MEKKNMAGKKLRYDLILIAALLAFALLVLAIIMVFRRDGGYVEVEVGGKKVAEYSLDADGEYSIGDGSNVLVIEGGEAYMSHADCPDKVCINRGRVKYVGQSIICLPNKVSVTVRGGAQDGVDLVS